MSFYNVRPLPEAIWSITLKGIFVFKGKRFKIGLVILFTVNSINQICNIYIWDIPSKVLDNLDNILFW